MKIEVLDKNYVNDIHLIDKSAFHDYWTAENFLCDIATDTRCYLGLFENQKLVAYLSLNTVLDESDVIRIAVDKEYQGKGYGKELLTYSFQYLKILGVNKIMLEVSDINDRAIGLYKSLGFKQIFVRKKYYSDGSNALIFEKIL